MDLSITAAATRMNAIQKLGLAIGAIGLLILMVAWSGIELSNPALFLSIALLAITVGTIIYARATYLHLPEGIKNNGNWFGSLTSWGALAWIAAIFITGFYILLYWYPQWIGLGQNGAANTGLVALFDPLSMLLKGQAASEWFVYGTLYTIAILAFGYKFILKYRHNKYQILRTVSVMFFQLGFAFLLPEFLSALGNPYYNFANMWPLNYYFFDDWHIKGLLNAGNFGLFMLAFGLAMVFLISPVLTYFYGKRWYCSWVCGCGGLAETAGDPFRHLSNNSLAAWKVERWMIHSVLVFSVVMTGAVIYTFFNNNAEGFWLGQSFFMYLFLGLLVAAASLVFIFPKFFKEMDKNAKIIIPSILLIIALIAAFSYFTGRQDLFFIESYKLRKWYGFGIGAAFSGVVGVGFYPILGSRVWCRYGCPMAAILGLQQKFFSRFRITTNGGQCISCGNCSTYCEMGIDVRAYAQKGQDIVRASCVGCGVCSAVCPRGVLKLENSAKDVSTRASAERAIHIDMDDDFNPIVHLID